MDLKSNHTAPVLADPAPISKSRLVASSLLPYSSPAPVFSPNLLLTVPRKKIGILDDVRASSWLDAMKSSSPRHTSTRDYNHEILSADTDVAYRTWMVKYPSALSSFEQITNFAKGKRIALFLDYDGTLSPIVDNPDFAFMSIDMRAAVAKVAKYFPTAIISGRSRDKVYDFVGLTDLYYAGSHGMDIMGPVRESSDDPPNCIRSTDKQGKGVKLFQPASEFLPMIDEVSNSLVNSTKEIKGAKVENNKFCVSVHYRNVDEKNWKTVAQCVHDVPLPLVSLHIWSFRYFTMPSFDTILLRDLVAAACLFFITRYFIRRLLSNPKRTLPPGPKGWPVVGALPLLGSMPHVELAKLAKKYGPVMYLKMGTCNMVVASTPDAARAFLKTLDLNFSNRPSNAGATHIAYNSQDMVFAEYGPRWKLLRKLSNLHMLGGKALEDWSQVRAVELGHMLRAMCESSRKGEPVVVPEMLTYAMANMIGQVILSRRVFVTKGSESNEFKDMVVELMTSAGLFNIGDFIPSIAWMDLQGIEGEMKKLHKRWDVLLTKMMKEHEETAYERKGKPDFLDIIMDNRENSAGERLSLTNVKALLLNLFTAGTDTSSSIIEWALAEILKNPKILNKAHEEMDKVIGRNRRLEESDIPKLPYLQAICKETFRKHPSTPLNLPRVSTQACEINGYYIPKNTRLSVNIWAIGRDPDVWGNPLDFTPERFLSGRFAKIDPRGNDFELIPFGAGRRICAGTRMGIVLVEYILGTLLHSFDWMLPPGTGELNMDESFGLALQKTVPLSAMVRPRLAPTAYVS